MKTLAQLCPRRDSIFWFHSSEACKLVSSIGKPTHTIVSRSGEHYFGWHEPCYKATAFYRPVNSPQTRRPIRLCGKDITGLSVMENFGEYHHRFKKMSSRRLRKALKRELEKEAIEAEDILSIPEEIDQMFLLWEEQEECRQTFITMSRNMFLEDIKREIERNFNDTDPLENIRHDIQSCYDEYERRDYPDYTTESMRLT
jgi:hypothetical protein